MNTQALCDQVAGMMAATYEFSTDMTSWADVERLYAGINEGDGFTITLDGENGAVVRHEGITLAPRGLATALNRAQRMVAAGSRIAEV